MAEHEEFSIRIESGSLDLVGNSNDHFMLERTEFNKP